MEYKRIYLAYGSNMNLKQMAERCPDARLIGVKMLSGYALEFRYVATIVSKEDAEVPLLVWEIGQDDELSLDYYEGFPYKYRKEIFELEIDGRIRECMAYLMNAGEIEPPSSRYYNVIRKGYEDNGIDVRYLQEAEQQAIQYQQNEARLHKEDLQNEQSFWRRLAALFGGK